LKRFPFTLTSFSVIVLFSIITLITVNADALLLSKTNLDHYLENDLILVGRVISAIGNVDTLETEYQIDVERYLKSPKSYETVTALGQGVKGGLLQSSIDVIFDEGDRVFLLLDEVDEIFVISPYSFRSESFNPDSEFILPPLKLHRSGISSDDIVCRGDLVLVKKSTNGMPACVRENHIERLVSIGWLDEDFLKSIK